MKRILFLLLLIVLAACTAVSEDPPSANNEAEVYTAVIRQIYTINDTFGGSLQPPTVYLLSQTDDSMGDPETEQLPTQAIDEATQQAVVAGLDDLPAEWIWVNGREDVPINPETGSVEGDGVIITLGSIHTQDDGSLLVPSSIYVANLAAGGQTFILEQSETGWIITGTTGVEWIS